MGVIDKKSIATKVIPTQPWKPNKNAVNKNTLKLQKLQAYTTNGFWGISSLTGGNNYTHW